MITKIALLIGLLLPFTVAGKGGFDPQILSVVEKYKASKLVTMSVLKEVKSELLDKKTDYKGLVFLSGEKFRLDTETPDKAVLLFNGKTIMNVQYPPKELGGTVQVTKSKVSKQNRSQILLLALTDSTSLKKNFKVLKTQKTGSVLSATLKPLTKDLMVRTIDLKMDVDKKLLLEVFYTDDVGNATKMQFSDIKFSAKSSAKTFEFEIPKDAQVTNL